jgi:hypothetical protein
MAAPRSKLEGAASFVAGLELHPLAPAVNEHFFGVGATFGRTGKDPCTPHEAEPALPTTGGDFLDGSIERASSVVQGEAMKSLTSIMFASLVCIAGCGAEPGSSDGAPADPAEPTEQTSQPLVFTSLQCQPLLNTINGITETSSFQENGCSGGTDVEMFTLRGSQTPSAYPWNVFGCTGGFVTSRTLGDGSCQMNVQVTGCNLFGVPTNFYGEGQFYQDTSGAAHLIAAQTVVLNNTTPPCKNHMIISEQH